VLATTTLTQFKVELVATEGTPGGAPLATVTAIGYEPAGNGWKEVASETVGSANQWFWYPVEVCSFTVTELEPGPSTATDPDVMRVSLLITPAIGCSKTYTEHWKP
jgi:hypothetical protein